MPSFDAQILSPPSAFSNGCKSLNVMFQDNPETLASLLTDAVRAVKSGQTYSGDDLNSEMKNGYRSIVFLARAWSASSPQPSPKEVASALDSNSLLSREVIEAFVTVWTQSSSVSTLTNIIQAGANVSYV